VDCPLCSALFLPLPQEPRLRLVRLPGAQRMRRLQMAQNSQNSARVPARRTCQNLTSRAIAVDVAGVARCYLSRVEQKCVANRQPRYVVNITVKRVSKTAFKHSNLPRVRRLEVSQPLLLQ
jgi:hypothetical protein